MNQCSCGSTGDLTFPLLSRFFCEKCFSQQFEKKFLRQIPMKARGHVIAVAFSGGKDSATVLHILTKYQRKLKIRKLYVFILEEEMPEIQLERELISNQLKEIYSNVDIVKKTYTDLFGYSLPDLIDNSDKKGLRFTPCTICGVLRRHGLQRISLEFEVDYIVKGHTLDDEAETILLNILRGIPKKNFRHQIQYESVDGISLPIRIKPLSTFLEKTIKEYFNINQLKKIDIQCPYAIRSLRSRIRTFLDELKKESPSILFNITAGFRRDLSSTNKIVKVQKCQSCNSYSPNLECSACRLVRNIAT